MSANKLKDGIYSVGAVDWDRKIFDDLVPLPDGTSYNSYLIKGSDKVALLDTVDPAKENELMENLKSSKADKIDYIIAHHAEQDHSGAIPLVLKNYPMAKVVTNAKCRDMLMDLLPIPAERFITIKDRETLPLGGRTLTFILAPWVHWPETMLTYLDEDKMLFTCDLFGSHLATKDIYADNEAKTYNAAKRYYAEIMMPFRTIIRKHLEILKGFEFDSIATSHGPVYLRPEFIIDAYRDWTSDDVKNEVVLVYASAHGSTQKMVKHLSSLLNNKGVVTKEFHMASADIGDLAIALVDAATVVVASPTILAGPHPAALYAAIIVNALRPKTRFVSVIGSYGWGEKAADSIVKTLANLKVEFLPPVIAKGYPREEGLKELGRLASDIESRHNGLFPKPHP